MTASSRASFRVLLVAGEYPPALGGVADYTALLARQLWDSGVTVTVLAPRSGSAAAPSAHQGGAVRYVVRDWGFGSWRSIARVVALDRPDILHVQYQAGAFGGRAAIPLLPLRFPRGRRPRIVVTFHDLHAPYLFPKAGRLRPAALRFLARACSSTIATNGEDFDRLTRQLGGRAPDLIPIGSNIPAHRGDPERTRQEVREQLGLGRETLLLAYFGLIGASKGIETLLDALQLIHAGGDRGVHLVIVGGEPSATDRQTEGGPALAELVAHRELQGLVHRVGHVAPATAALLLAGSDLVVLPFRDGASWRHGSLLAALAQGRPALVTPPRSGYTGDGALPSMIDGENVVMAPAGDSHALATSIMRVAGDPLLRLELSAGAARLARHFSWEYVAARHVQLYERLLQRDGPR